MNLKIQKCRVPTTASDMLRLADAVDKLSGLLILVMFLKPP